MASASLAFPIAPRCDRPSAEISSLSALQPGGLAHGPDEKFGRSGLVRGSARRTSAPAAIASLNLTLLAESSRRVGTAWPGAGCNGWARVDNRRRERFALRLSNGWNAAPHNSLIFLETRFRRSELNDSSCSSDASSRNRAAQVEFVNHPEAVWLRRYARRATGIGRGAGELLSSMDMTQHAFGRARGALERGRNDPSIGRYDGVVPRSGPFHP